MVHDRIVNQHTPGIALYPRSLSYDLLPLIGPAGWSLLRALHDHADEQALTYRGARPIAPSAEELQALAGVGEASLLVIKDLLRICGCLSWEDVRGKQAPRPGRQVKQAPTRALVYYLHPLTGLTVTADMVQRVCRYAARSDRAQAYLKANGLLRRQPAFLPMSVWPTLLPWLLNDATWQTLFQHVHGADAHRTYQGAAAHWLMSAAEVIATLEWEQQSLHDRTQIDVQNRAVMVLARWNATDTVASWRGNGPHPASRHDSPCNPHTPNESISQPTRQDVAGGGEKNIERAGRRSDPHAHAESHPSRLADAEVNVVQQADAVGQLELADMQNKFAAVLPADAEALSQAEAALWAALPPLLADSSSTPPGGNDQPHYQPTRSEVRQARRLLRAHRLDTILAAVRDACATYEPTSGQAASITRFGFAVGLPAFRAALASATPNRPSSPIPTAPPIIRAGKITGGTLEQDFWSEYTRVTGRDARVAERRRIEAVAALAEWQQLLIWLDRWEQAHPHGDTQLSPGYFEACATDGANRTNSTRESQMPDAVVPAPLPLTPEQQHAYTRLAEYGITTAPTLATLSTTTIALVDAWIGAAAQRATIKDKRAYVAAGVKSGQLPRDVRYKPQPAPIAQPPKGTESAALQVDQRIWAACLQQVAGIVPQAEFETWIQPCALVELDQAQAVIGTPNVFVREHVAQRYHSVIQQAVERVTGYAVQPLFVIQG